MQHFGGVEPQQVADRGDRRAQDHQDHQDRHQGDDDGREGDRGSEDGVADDLRQREPRSVAEDAARQADDDGLGEEQPDDRLALRPDGLHEPDLAGALHDAGGHQVRDRQRRGDEGQGGHQHHEELGLLQDRALGLGDLADGARHGVGHDLLDLVGDGGHVGGAVPGLLLGHGQRLGVLRGLARQVVVGGGQGRHFDAAHRPLAPQELLDEAQLGVDGVVGVVPGGEHAPHDDVAGRGGTGQGDRVADAHAVGRGVGGADHRARLVGVVGPRALDAPPAPQLVEAGLHALLGGQVEAVGEPGPRDGDGAPVGSGGGGRQQRGEVQDVVGPEDRLDLHQLVLAQVRLLLRGALRGVEVLQDRGALGAHDDVRAIALELLVDFVAHVEHDGEHGGGHAGAQRHRQGDHRVPVAAPGERALEHSEEHGPYFAKTGAAASRADTGTVSVPLPTSYSMGIGLHPPLKPMVAMFIATSHSLQMTFPSFS